MFALFSLLLVGVIGLIVYLVVTGISHKRILRFIVAALLLFPLYYIFVLWAIQAAFAIPITVDKSEIAAATSEQLDNIPATREYFKNNFSDLQMLVTLLDDEDFMAKAIDYNLVFFKWSDSHYDEPVFHESEFDEVYYKIYMEDLKNRPPQQSYPFDNNLRDYELSDDLINSIDQLLNDGALKIHFYSVDREDQNRTYRYAEILLAHEEFSGVYKVDLTIFYCKDIAPVVWDEEIEYYGEDGYYLEELDSPDWYARIGARRFR